MNITLDSQIKVPDTVLVREVSGEIVLLNLDSGQYYGLDAVGTHMWFELASGKTVSRAVDTLLDEYDVERAEVQRDLLSLVASLAEQNLVEVVDAA